MNYNKSSMYVSPNIEEEAAAELSARMGIPLTKELGRYSGHNLVHKGRGGSEQNVILERVRGKMGGWKASCLSLVGRITLARSVLSNMAVFFMQAQQLSAKVHKELNKAVRQCIWGLLHNEEKGTHT